MHKWVLALLLGAAGCVSLPKARLDALAARQPFTTFDPSGIWLANGNFVGKQANNQMVTVEHDGIAYKVRREVEENGVMVRADGVGFVDGDRFFVGYGPAGFEFSVEVYEVPQTPAPTAAVDGWWVNNNQSSGILQITPRGPLRYAGQRLAADYDLVGGNDHLSYKQRLQLFAPAVDGVFWGKWKNGGTLVNGVGIADGDRLALIGLLTQTKDFVDGVTSQARGFVELAVYHLKDGALEGSAAFGNTVEAAQGTTAPAVLAERWTRQR